METSVRLILLFIGFVIIAGIFWDINRHKKNARKSKSLKTKKSFFNLNFLKSDDNIQSDEELLDEIIREEPQMDPLMAPIESFEHQEPFTIREPLNINLEEATRRISVQNVQDNLQNKVNSSSHVNHANHANHSNQVNSASPDQYNSQIMALTVMARQPGCFLGKRLLEAFQEVHLHFGDRKIFHRYENQDGTGRKIFSLTSMIEPGYFNLSKMDVFTTPGILLFFPLGEPNQSISAFEQMLRTAKLLCLRLDGELKDERRRPLSDQMIDQLRETTRSLSFV